MAARNLVSASAASLAAACSLRVCPVNVAAKSSSLAKSEDFLISKSVFLSSRRPVLACISM